MIKKDFYETDMVNEINEKIKFIKRVNVEFADQCLGNARSALEAAVKLFWWEKYNIKIETYGGASSKLFNAMDDTRFTRFFDDETLKEMNRIREQGNKALHNESDLTLEEASELLKLLGECIVEIEKAIPMQILDDDEEIKPIIEPTKTTYKSCVKEKDNYGETVLNYFDVNERQKRFYDAFQSALDQNGNPFTFKARKGYGTINKRSANSDLCLGFDFWVPRKGFRLNIYIRNDSQTHYYDRLLRYREEIERELGFKPEWVDHGAQNPNTRRIQTCLYFNEHSIEEYEWLLDEALPMIIKYLQVFTKYLPEAFESDK